MPKAAERVQLDQAAVAAKLGVAVTSVQRYRVADRGRYGFPDPDGYIGRSPWWWSSSIDEWVASRPGKGAGAGRPRKQHVAKVERDGSTYRWVCSCGDVSSWTRRADAVRAAADRHTGKAAH